MTVEERLRRALTDERHALPGWTDAVERVGAGVRRRRRRRVAAVALTVLAITGLGVPTLYGWTGAIRGSDGTGADGVAAWTDAGATQPTLARREPRPDARDCAVADLGPVSWIEGSGKLAGDGATTLLLGNKSESRCTLRGSVGLSGVDRNTGRRTALQNGETGRVEDAAHQYPATIDPGEPARLDVGTTGPCADGTKPTRYRDIAVVTMGHEFPVSGLEIGGGCRILTGAWYVQPPLLNAPYRSASITAPATVRRGTSLEYEVTVRNEGDGSLRLDPCPVYIQKLGDIASTHRLNCSRSVVSSRSAMRFQMRIAVPADAALGKTSLTWMAVMGDGRVTIADLAEGGVSVDVIQ
jgi:hypothetical protein